MTDLHYLIVSIFVLICTLLGDIKLNIYDNSVHYGVSNEIVTLNSLNYTFGKKYVSQTFSAEIEGTINWLKDIDLYYFTCNYSLNLFGFVWIDDHCICAPQIYKPPQFINWNLSWTSSAYNKRESFIRIHIFHNYDDNNSYLLEDTDISFQILWSFNNNHSLTIVNNTYLSSYIDALQKQRILFQKDLINNTFSTYYVHNILSIVRLPDSFGLIFGICSDKNQTKCLMSAVPENNYVFIGSHSNNHSYFEYNISWEHFSIQYKYAQLIYNESYSNLYISMTLINQVTDNKYPYIGVSQQFYWNKTGIIKHKNVKISSILNCFLDIKGYGLVQHWSLCTNSNGNSSTNNGKIQYFQFNENMKTLYFTTDIFNNIDDINYISNVISNEEMIEYNTYKKFGNYSETKRAIQSGLLWNLIYTPEEIGVFAQVARSWTGGNNDYIFVIYDWDTLFASYMLSLDLSSLNISISNLIQVIKAKTVHGFIPNMKQVKLPYLMNSEDRTEPILGSFILLQIYNKYKNNAQTKKFITFIIEFLFNDLLDWISWVWIRRRCATHYLICLGSDPNEPLIKDTHNTMNSARMEEADNSPMYDGNFFDNITHHMLLYDVGMNSLYSSEINAFIKLANIINYNNSLILNQWKTRYQFIKDGISKYLWNSTMNLFINKRSDTNNFYVRISPTSFYPLLTLNVLNNTQNITMYDIELMVSNYLLSSNHFCIDKNSSNWPLNQSSDCYYGLPSISKSDVAFKDQNYWRGLTWSPMAQIVWWSLQEYIINNDIINTNNTHYKFIKNTQLSLQFQMNKMMLNIWNNRRHICENYSPGQSANECTGNSFYHWGGLAGFISLINPYYNA